MKGKYSILRTPAVGKKEREMGRISRILIKDICPCSRPGRGMALDLWKNSVKVYVVPGNRDQEIGDILCDGHCNSGNYRALSVLS